MWRLAAMFALTVGMAAAEGGFQPQTGAEIRAVLTDVVLVYDRGWQDVRASGRTLYHVGGDSWGDWNVQGDPSCSQWPPSEHWECYDMARDGDVLRFISARGHVTDGRLR